VNNQQFGLGRDQAIYQGLAVGEARALITSTAQDRIQRRALFFIVIKQGHKHRSLFGMGIQGEIMQQASLQWLFYSDFNRKFLLIMILELADIQILPGKQTEFDSAIVNGVQNVISKSKGFRGYKIHKGIESPDRYVLMIFWDTLENHTVDFRESELFTQWRGIVGPFFSAPPKVEHFDLLSKSE
jgi:heme-degrading monooxygenase HmoA